MTRSSIRFTGILTLALAALSFTAFAAKKKPEESAAPKVHDPAAFKAKGTILECTDYLLTGRTPDTNRSLQTKNIEAGLPICFVPDEEDEVYLLVEPSAQASSRIQPIENFLGGGVVLDGVVYQKGNLKAITINQIGRSGPYMDRETRRAKNPEPTRHENIPGTKKDPSLP